MPFYAKKEQTHVNEVIVRREVETVREVPIMTGQMDSLSVRDLTITGNICIPDITQFYPPNPHIFHRGIMFNGIAELAYRNTPFLQFDQDTSNVLLEKLRSSIIHTDCIESDHAKLSTLVVDTIHTSALTLSTLCVGRIEATANIIGGVVLRDGGFSAPGNVNVGSHFIAMDGTIGGVSLKQNEVHAHEVHAQSMYAQTVSFDYIETSRIHCTAPCIVFGGVKLLSGNIECSNLTANNISTAHIQTHTLDCSRITGSVTFDSDILTPSARINSIVATSANVCELVTVHTRTDTAHIGTADICRVNTSDVHTRKLHCGPGVFSSIDTPTLSASSVISHSVCASLVETSKLNVDEISINGAIRAPDFRLPDGTSILHNVFPIGMIMLFSGKTPPRGWLECNGKGGTPMIPGPAKDVIYVIRR
jgi:hypothetical protein